MKTFTSLLAFLSLLALVLSTAVPLDDPSLATDNTFATTFCQQCSQYYKDCMDQCYENDCEKWCKGNACRALIGGKRCGSVCLWKC